MWHQTRNHWLLIVELLQEETFNRGNASYLVLLQLVFEVVGV